MDEFEMTPARWRSTSTYVREVFAREDAVLSGLMARATTEGLPAIDAGPESGRLLQMLTMIAGGRRAIEVGTLAGVSAIWIARGLRDDGRLISIDIEPKHQRVAQREATAAGVADRIEFRLGRGSEVLPTLLRELGAGSVDLIFLDAERSEYLPMLPTVKQLLRPRGVLVIDNALHARRFVPDPYSVGEPRDTMDEVNRAVAADTDFAASTLLPIGNGLLVATRGE